MTSVYINFLFDRNVLICWCMHRTILGFVVVLGICTIATFVLQGVLTATWNLTSRVLGGCNPLNKTDAHIFLLTTLDVCLGVSFEVSNLYWRRLYKVYKGFTRIILATVVHPAGCLLSDYLLIFIKNNQTYVGHISPVRNNNLLLRKETFTKPSSMFVQKIYIYFKAQKSN